MLRAMEQGAVPMVAYKGNESSQILVKHGKECTMEVSICIPAYNNAQHIGETIESVLAQTFTDFELVIVDDNSKDNTVEVVQEYMKKDSRVVLYQNEKNLGMSGNWNRCVEMTKGEFVKLICADDILMPDCLENEVRAIKKAENISMVISDSQLIDNDKKKIGTFPRYHKAGLVGGAKIAKASLIMINYFGMPCAVLFRRACFDKVGGFDSNYKYILDFDLWMNMAGTGAVYVIKECLNGFRLRNDSNTGKVFSTEQKDYFNEHKYLVNKYKDKYGINKAEYGISLFSRWGRDVANGLFIKLKVRKK